MPLYCYKGIDFRRQILTSTDVRIWRIKSNCVFDLAQFVAETFSFKLCFSYVEARWMVGSNETHRTNVDEDQFSLYVHKGGLKPDFFHFIFQATDLFSLDKNRGQLETSNQCWISVSSILSHCQHWFNIYSLLGDERNSSLKANLIISMCYQFQV